MDALFSCRNCIHNGSQTLTIGRGMGFCLKHDSVIWHPEDTTCKYLHRKDLPSFLVDEGIREHAAEFAQFSGMARLSRPEPIGRIRYSEKFCWERKKFDPIIHALALYYRNDEKHWIFIQTFAAGVDGRRSVAYTSLIRRYMNICETWANSYRLVLSFIQEIDSEPQFDEHSLAEIVGGHDQDELRREALWDVVFCRLSTLQEYGWHASLEDLRWVTDSLNGSLSNFDWPALKRELMEFKETWTEEIIDHAKRNEVFFPIPTDDLPRE
ncbi:MAG: hypothetical protein GC191_21135 [Azospirillum sp.]|nr:hypothetical protein [Azospirillum sp.]